MSWSLEVNDPVLVARGDDHKLEGVVAYVGAVEFSADEDDWVGIRLTGDSAGQGKNDGTVQGKSYFACPSLCGIFVKRSAVSKRELTKLEELKLRRELGRGTTAAMAAVTTPGRPGATSSRASSALSSGTRTPPTTAASSTTIGKSPGPTRESPATTGTATAAVGSPAASSGAAATTTRDKLEELRLRRAALQARKKSEAAAPSAQVVPLPSTTTTATTVPTSRTASVASSSLSPTLSTASLEGLGTAAASSAALSPAQSPSVGATALTAATDPVSQPPRDADLSQQQQQELQQELQQLQRELEQANQSILDKETELDQMRNQCRDAQALVEKHRRDADQARHDAQEAQNRESLAAMAASHAAAPSSPEEDPSSSRVYELEREAADATDRADALQAQVTQLERELKDLRTQSDAQLLEVRTGAAILQSELNAALAQHDQRGAGDASHYKERAKLQSELAAHKRRIEQLEREKQDLEATVEDLALDKEQLEQDKENLEDRLDELKLDAETAQMEVEELKMELDDARAAADRLAAATNEESGKGTDDAEDVAQALSIQNARLREALIRLREQSSIEKMELSRQLREAEKDADAGRQVSAELESCKTLMVQMEEQLNDLKDMVEQGAAFESMVEDLSDRVLSMEDENVALRSTIRELEDAAELTAEMEELQTEEVKALTRDLEGRDTIIRNLEEAIKMQRRREDDFLRTVSNYRSTVATLKQERQSLLEIRQGGEGEKSKVMASSQTALAKAAQLVSEAAALRQREAAAIMDKIEKQWSKSLCVRMESLLPHGFVGPELSAMKGELHASRAVGVASSILEGISSCFGKVIRPSLGHFDARDDSFAGLSPPPNIPDEVLQKSSSMIFQAEVSRVVIDVSSDLIRLLAAGQWPNLVSQAQSIEIGSHLGHPSASIESTLSAVLKCLKEEGLLTPEQTNLEGVHRSLQTSMQSLMSDLKPQGEKPIVSSDWVPPGWNLFKDATLAKYYIMGAAAALSIVTFGSDNATTPRFASLYHTLEQVSAHSSVNCLRLSGLDVMDEPLMDKLSKMVTLWKNQALTLLKSVESVLLGAGDQKACEDLSEALLSHLAQLSTSLRSAKVASADGTQFHALSPETNDCWSSLAMLTRSIRSIDADADDVHFLSRAREVEQHLSLAVEMLPKLDAATAKVVALEKTIGSKAKEASMLTARLSEIEKLLAKTQNVGTPVGRGPSFDFRSSDEFSALQEENRMLSEAIDVLHRQVDEYENEIRALKDFKSPGRGNRARGTPRRALTSVADVSSPYGRAPSDDGQVNTVVLEATLFRPALQRALKEAAVWKSMVVHESLLKLTPLPTSWGSCATARVEADHCPDALVELNLALASYRNEVASLSLIDLSRRDKNPRQQLQESLASKAVASRRLQSIVRRCRGQVFF